MKCKICAEPIILRPSAKERARRYGGKPSDYEKLFQTHSSCQVRRNSENLKKLLTK